MSLTSAIRSGLVKKIESLGGGECVLEGGGATKLITIHHVDNILASSFTTRLQLDFGICVTETTIHSKTRNS